MTRVTRRSTESDPLDDVAPLLTEFGGHRKMSKELEARMKGLRDKLMAILERRGKPDDKGSLWLEFDEPVAGFEAICRQRRASVVLDESRAEEILTDAGIYDECTDVQITIDAEQMDLVLDVLRKAGIFDQVVTVNRILNDDKIMQVYFAEKDSEEPRLTESDIEAMFTEKVTWAFVPKESA